MKTCVYCGRENEDAAVSCHDCGASDFRSVSPVPPATGASKIVFEPLKADELNHDWVTLTRCMTIFEADAIAMRLRAAEIPVFIPDEFLMQGISFNTITYGMVRVQVPPSQYQEACDVLQD